MRNSPLLPDLPQLQDVPPGNLLRACKRVARGSAREFGFADFCLQTEAGFEQSPGKFLVNMSAHPPNELNRFLEAQEDRYERALAEIRSGRKRSHWMWFVFPQIEGLGHSATARFYAIRGIEEAQAFLAHPVLGSRLRECAQAALSVEGKSAEEIFGFPDVLKLRSCATLFAQVSEPGSVFERLLEKYYGGAADEATMRLMGKRE
jgi:uncharacterized protein (DUF1810 family)